jgi:hypothetical protein
MLLLVVLLVRGSSLFAIGSEIIIVVGAIVMAFLAAALRFATFPAQS